MTCVGSFTFAAAFARASCANALCADASEAGAMSATVNATDAAARHAEPGCLRACCFVVACASPAVSRRGSSAAGRLAGVSWVLQCLPELTIGAPLIVIG